MVAAALIGVVAAVTLGACATMESKTASSGTPSLYKRLGGREGIRGVIDDFVANLSADPRASARFKGMKPPDVERLKTNASDQLCEATGGPCSYLGKDMKTAHKGMNITEAEWDAGVDALVKALDKHKVAPKDKEEVLAKLAPMKKDIVGQ
jgi:hemoglobin